MEEEEEWGALPVDQSRSSASEDGVTRRSKSGYLQSGQTYSQIMEEKQASL